MEQRQIDKNDILKNNTVLLIIIIIIIMRLSAPKNLDLYRKSV